MESGNDFKIANKIKRLEQLKMVFTTLAIIVGIITVVDMFIPDPILLLDEAALASITGLFTLIMTQIDDKIKKLKSGNKADVTIEEVKSITSAAGNTANAIKKSRKR